MKLSICYNENGRICHVHTFDYYLDKGIAEEKIVEQTQKLNGDAGYERFKTVEVPQDLEEVLSMLLGEKKYKRTKDIEDILDSLEEVDNTISNVSRDIFDASEAMEETKKLVQELKEKVDKELKTSKKE
jgi:methyl-accepting chemotaxis protein